MKLLYKLRYIVLFFVSLVSIFFLFSLVAKNYGVRIDKESLAVIGATVSTLSPAIIWVYEFLQKVKKEILQENDHLEKKMDIILEEFHSLKNAKLRDRVNFMESSNSRLETKMEVLFDLFKEVLKEEV